MINAININVTIIKHLKSIANIYKNNANKKNFLLNLINIIVNDKKKRRTIWLYVNFNGLQIYFKALNVILITLQ